jgi:hypothetical protein
MTTTFNTVFSVTVFHDYFENLICNSLEFTPSDSTRRLINRYGFKIRDKVNGFEFYATSKANITDFLRYVEVTTQQNCLEFDIKTTDNNFTLFTQMPSKALGQLQYSSSNTIINNGKQQLEANYLPMDDTMILGTLKIYFKDLVQFIENKVSCNFEITFKAIATQWQYYILNKSGLNLDNLSISSKSTINFEGPISLKIQTDEEALFFSSGEQYIKLCNVPKYQFDLINKTTTNQTIKVGTGKIIFKGLPNPNPQQTEAVLINGITTETSQMYVYI